MERPLDTIRSFERAIDNGYRKRTSYGKAGVCTSFQDNINSLPSSNMSVTETSDGRSQYNASTRNSGFYNGKYSLTNRRLAIANSRLLTGYESGANASRYTQSNGGGYYGGSGPSGPPRTRYGPRMQSDPIMYGQRSYPPSSYQQSQDTMNTGYTNGSDSTGPWANSTDPSSENSSLDPVTGAMKPNGENGYAQHGYGPNGYAPGGYGPGGYDQGGYGQNGYGQNGYGPSGHAQNGYGPGGYGQGGHGPNNYSPTGYSPTGFQNSIPEEGGAYNMGDIGLPVQPPKSRRPIPLGNTRSSSSIPGQYPSQSRQEPEKRKSWLKRAFSKKG